MAIQTVQDSSLVAVTPVPVAGSSGGDSFANNGAVMLELINGSGGSLTITADDVGTPTPPGTLVSTFNPDTQAVVAAGARKLWGPFPPYRFNDANGRVNLTYSANPPTGLTIGYYRTRSS